MMKLSVLYAPPTDVPAFDEHYVSVHTPMAKDLPGLARFESAAVVATPDGSPAPYHRTADLYFESLADMQESLASDLGRQTAQDAADLAARTGSSVTFLIASVD